MTSHRSLRRPVGLLSAILVVASFADEAASQPRDCAAFRALANADGRDFADLRLRMNAEAGVSVGVDADGGDWLNAPTCDMEAGDGDADISCQWEFSSRAAATAFHDALLERLRRCLPSGFPRQTVTATLPSWRTIRRNAGEFGREGARTEVELALIEASTPAPGAPDRMNVIGHHVVLTALGTFDEPEDDEDEDEDEDENEED